jgi:hypothetical protein
VKKRYTPNTGIALAVGAGMVTGLGCIGYGVLLMIQGTPWRWVIGGVVLLFVSGLVATIVEELDAELRT